jgi:Yip1 domain
MTGGWIRERPDFSRLWASLERGCVADQPQPFEHAALALCAQSRPAKIAHNLFHRRLDKWRLCPILKLLKTNGFRMETIPSNPDNAAKPPQTSVVARLLNIFAAPGEVFEEVKNSPPSVANWLTPTLILVVVGIIATFVILSQPAVIQQIRDQRQSAFDKQVRDGKMTQAQADQAEVATEKFFGPSALKIFGSFSAVIGSFVVIFWWALLLWLIGRFYLKAPLTYVKALEVSGLAGMIGVLAAVLKTLLVMITGNALAAPSLILLIKKFDPGNPVHHLLALTDVTNFWLLAVRSVGLAKLTNSSFGKAAMAVFGIWLLFALLIFGVTMAMQSLHGK